MTMFAVRVLCVLVVLVSVFSVSHGAFTHASYYPYAEGSPVHLTERWPIRATPIVNSVPTPVNCDDLVQNQLSALYRPGGTLVAGAGKVVGVAVTLENEALYAYYSVSGTLDATVAVANPTALPIPNANWKMVRWSDVQTFAADLPAYAKQTYAAPVNIATAPSPRYQTDVNGDKTVINRYWNPNPKIAGVLKGRQPSELKGNDLSQYNKLTTTLQGQLLEGGNAVGTCALAKLALYLKSNGKSRNVQCVAEAVIGDNPIPVNAENGTPVSYSRGALIPSCATCQRQVRDIFTGRYSIFRIANIRRNVESRGGPLKRSNTWSSGDGRRDINKLKNKSDLSVHSHSHMGEAHMDIDAEGQVRASAPQEISLQDHTNAEVVHQKIVSLATRRANLQPL